jgi:tetratricopeptide (TPR) repeat protein/serine/threonine protein kinase
MAAELFEEKEIFNRARQIAAPQERAAYLQEACGHHPAAMTRLGELLRVYEEERSFLESSPVGHTAKIDAPIAECPGAFIGPYKLLEQIGEGGFGVVFMADQTEPVRRKVALKVLKPGMDTCQVVARFEAERQALAIMDHPNIAKVHDGGETATGRPYFVMELVKGVPITDYADQNQLTLRQRLELFVPVCQAIQHAHHKGIIHRDLKPSNVLVSQDDTTPIIKVIDFGVAKALGQELTDKTLCTGFAQMVGTPLYMSPEQAQLSCHDVDTRSDIYSLGLLLYELLTGTTPLDRERLCSAGYDEMRQMIRDEEPPKPSTRLSTLGLAATTAATRRQSDPRRLSRLLRGELDWIVMKTLEKDRNRRYETANSLARDVERYLHDEPVRACPPSAWYRLGKFVRRRKAGLQIAAAAALALLLAVGGVTWALLDRAAHRTELSKRMVETEQTVNAALVQTHQWRKQASEAPSATSQEADAVLALWRQAEASLAQAETAVKTGTADDRLRQRVLDVQQEIKPQRAQAQRKANLLRDLDDARMTRSILIGSRFDHATSASKYAAAFAAYGLEVTPGRIDEVARRIRAEQPAFREALIVALEDWSQFNLPLDVKLANPMRAIAAAADDDPWRQQYRVAATAKDATALRALSSQARRLSLPPPSLHLLAQSLFLQGDRDEAVDLLRWARGRHLTDFWIHYELGSFLLEGKDDSPAIVEEAIGCCRTALALRPATGAAHTNLGRGLHLRKRLDEAILSYRKAIDLDPKYARAHNNLALVLHDKNQLDEAIAEYKKAIELDPRSALPHNNLGRALRDKNQLDEAIAEHKKAIDLDPKSAPAHNNLGSALYRKNQVEQAIAEFKKAIDLDPRLAPVHFNLGIALNRKDQWDEAITQFRKAIELDPKLAAAHFKLGMALSAKNQGDEAIAEFRKAIELDPKDAMTHDLLGTALYRKNHVEQAIAEYKKAIELDPRSAPVRTNLGAALGGKKQWDEAIAEFRKAIELDPKHTLARYSLGVALSNKQQWDEAITEFRKAIDLDPKNAIAHHGLGFILNNKKQYDEAIIEFRKAIDLQPDDAEAHCELASILRSQGQLSASLDFFKRGHALGSKRKDWHYPSAQSVAEAEQLVRMEAKLRDVLAGKATPTDQRELLGLLQVCELKRRNLAGARLYADAFTAEPKLADDLKTGHRYTAARYAAVAAAGQGTDADKLDGREQSRLRQQALAWLRADLEQCAKRLEAGKPEDRQIMRATLGNWQRDIELRVVRDPQALNKLAAEEREAWRKLWADVAALLKKAGDAKG